MVYHNPELHRAGFNIALIEELLKIKGVIAMKDNARMPQEFVRLASVTRGKMSLFVNQGQYRAYGPIGAAGFWSIDAWMGPAPQLALRDAVARQDWPLADQITLDITGSAERDPASRETAAKGGFDMPATSIPDHSARLLWQFLIRWMPISGRRQDFGKELCLRYRRSNGDAS